MFQGKSAFPFREFQRCLGLGLWRGGAKAFSVLELVVVVAISVLILAVGFPLFSRSEAQRRVLSQTERVAGFIEMARGIARHPESETAGAYRVAAPNSQVINIQRLEDDGSGDLGATETLGDILNLGDLYRVDLPPIDFLVFSGEPDNGALVTATVSSTRRPDIFRVINIRENGIIEISDDVD